MVRCGRDRCRAAGRPRRARPRVPPHGGHGARREHRRLRGRRGGRTPGDGGRALDRPGRRPDRHRSRARRRDREDLAMSTTVITNIGELVTNDPARDGLLGLLADAAVVVDGTRIAWVGPAAEAPDADVQVDAGGRAVIPGFVDSHSHLVFAGDRSAEFEAGMNGDRYTAVARQFTEETTCLGAHVVPADTTPEAYVDLVTGPMLAAAVPHARWIDVFCEDGAFDVDQARTILAAGADRGLRGRLHANQLTYGGGVQLPCELGLVAVDHCTFLSDLDVESLRDSRTIATLLPGVEFSTRQPYPDARRLLDAGVRVAIASDCNPGSCFTSSLPLCIALAVREMGMTPAEAVHAATLRGARALDRDDVGVIAAGKRADLVVLDAPSHVHLAYRPGVPLVQQVWQGGRPV